MLRKPRKSDTPLDHQQEELARREQALREEMQKLQRMIEEAPRVAEEVAKRQREELLQRATAGHSRLDATMALSDKRHDDRWDMPRRGAMRKQRREGRILFIVLALTFFALVIWLLSHLRW
jgi:hypothetical protein